MKIVTKINRERFKEILSKYGHHLDVKVPIQNDCYEEKMISVLNNAVVYNPHSKSNTSGTMSSNQNNADLAMSFINNKASIYSSVFHFINGNYEIV